MQSRIRVPIFILLLLAFAAFVWVSLNWLFVGGNLGIAERATVAAGVSGILSIALGVGVAVRDFIKSARVRASPVSAEDIRRIQDHLFIAGRARLEDLATQRGLFLGTGLQLRWSLLHDISARPGEPFSKSAANEGGLVDHLFEEAFGPSCERRGNLIIAGAEGSGKTMAMSSLALSIYHMRKDSAEVGTPVWIAMGSWDPTKSDLATQATQEVLAAYPEIHEAPFRGEKGVRAMLTTGEAILFLDGMDEMPRHLRAPALRRIAELPPRIRVVMSSRTPELREAFLNSSTMARVVEIRPLLMDDVLSALPSGLTDSELKAWRPVVDRLRSNSMTNLYEALKTPLMVFLARVGFGVSARPPADLVQLASGLPSDGLRGELLDQYLRVSYPKREYRAAYPLLKWIASEMEGRDLTADAVAHFPLPWSRKCERWRPGIRTLLTLIAAFLAILFVLIVALIPSTPIAAFAIALTYVISAATTIAISSPAGRIVALAGEIDFAPQQGRWRQLGQVVGFLFIGLVLALLILGSLASVGWLVSNWFIQVCGAEASLHYSVAATTAACWAMVVIGPWLTGPSQYGLYDAHFQIGVNLEASQAEWPPATAWPVAFSAQP